jgi:cytochrome P450
MTAQVPWWGIIGRLMGKRINPDIFLDVVDKTPNDGIIVLRGLMTRLLVVGPAPLADVLVHKSYDFAKFGNVRRFLRPILGDGLVVVEGDRHKFLRKNTQPAFSFRHIKELYPMMWKKAMVFTDTLRSEASGEESGRVEMTYWASKVTLDIIGIAGLGREFHAMKNPDDEVVKLYDRLTSPSRDRFIFLTMSLLFPKLVRFLPWKMNRLFKEVTTGLQNICKQLVRDKQEAIVKNADDNFDILSLLIKTDNFSETELADQLLTFLAAGYVTANPRP